MSEITVSHIVAMAAQSRVIGKDNQLVWHIPEDLKHFKRTTLGKPIIMGRKTYDSVGFALPGRTNIVISRDPKLEIEGVLVVQSCNDAIVLGRKCCLEQGANELFVVGGADIYRQTLAVIDKIYLSVVDIVVEGDTFYPELAGDNWQLESSQTVESINNSPGFTLQIFVRA